MEKYLSFLFSISFLMVTSLMMKLLHTILWKPKMIEKRLKQQGIHGPSYKILIGNLKDISSKSTSEDDDSTSKPMKSPHDLASHLEPFLYKTMTNYGKVFVLWYGTIPRVVITDPKLIKEVFSRLDDFQKPIINSFRKLFVTGVANYDGEKWTKHRKILSPAFHVEKLKKLLPVFSTCCEEMVKKLDKLVHMEGCCELDMCPEYNKLTAYVISRAAFGNNNFETGIRIFELQTEQGKLFANFYYYMMIAPWLRLFPTKANARMREIYIKVQSLLKGIVEERRSTIESRDEKARDDLLGLLLESNITELRANKGSEDSAMGIEDVIEECKLFYFAGQKTTASLLTWTTIMLSMYPDWQERARAEVLNLIGNNIPTFDDLTQLKIVNMILLEVQRLYPALSFVRNTYKSVKLGEFIIPAGVQIYIPTNIVHSDPEIWGEDVVEFNPWRFSDGVSKASKDPNSSYIPFGSGPRICVGQNFAMLQIKMLLARMLQHFSFELSPSYVHAPTTVITLQPLYGAQIILRKT